MLLLATVSALAASAPRIVLVGGTGRIGTAVAAHLLTIGGGEADIELVLAGRDASRGAAAIEEVRSEATQACGSISFAALDWRDGSALESVLHGAAAVVHTAGPYAGETPDVLSAAIRAEVPVYVDLSDPVEYLDAAAAMDPEARAAGTLALCAAGAFPGLSNVLAMECASRLGGRPIKDLDFAYFTAGLGGSGDVNLYITNDGFGDTVPTFRAGAFDPQLTAGSGARRVSFFLDADGPSADLVGERTVWNWPFPEGCTVARQLGISGDSSVGMGTSPELWNVIMGLMVDVVPRHWWKSRDFSLGLARFSKPLVAVTDAFGGETHAMRVACTAEDGSTCTAVQSHKSFRRVVGQSCAEFTARLLAMRGVIDLVGKEGEQQPRTQHEMPSSGVFLPESLFGDADEARQTLLERLLSVEGTVEWGFEVELASDASDASSASRISMQDQD